jgi:hypothetical protein
VLKVTVMDRLSSLGPGSPIAVDKKPLTHAPGGPLLQAFGLDDLG